MAKNLAVCLAVILVLVLACIPLFAQDMDMPPPPPYMGGPVEQVAEEPGEEVPAETPGETTGSEEEQYEDTDNFPAEPAETSEPSNRPAPGPAGSAHPEPGYNGGQPPALSGTSAPGLDSSAVPNPPPAAGTPKPVNKPSVRELKPEPEIQLPAPAPERGSSAASGTARNWAVFKGDPAHTGYTSESLAVPLKLAWKHTSEVAADNPASPAVVDGVVYFCSGRHLYAVHADTGALKWRYPADGSLNAAAKTTPAVGDDLVYFGAADGLLYAIRKEDGAQAWNFRTKGPINSSPVLSNGMIFVGSSDDNLYALDAQTGQMKWPGAFRTRDDVSSSPAIGEGLVYFVSNEMVLYAAHTTTGKIKWTARVGSVSRSSSPVLSESLVYLATGNVLQAFHAQSGRLKWGTPFPSDVTTVPAIGNGVIYLACKNGKLYAVTTSGEMKWKTPVGLEEPTYGSPVIAGDMVIVGLNKGALLALDAETGQTRWKYTVVPTTLTSTRLEYANIASAPAVSGGGLYILSDDGALHAFRADVPDSTPPYVSQVVPARDYLMPGAPPVEIAAVVSDPGSGIRPDSISMLLDGQPLEYQLTPHRGLIWYRTPRTQSVVPLKDGKHTVTLSLADWAGNKTETTWSFNVDNRIRTAQPPATGGTGATMPKPGPGVPGMPRPPGSMPVPRPLR